MKVTSGSNRYDPLNWIQENLFSNPSSVDRIVYFGFFLTIFSIPIGHTNTIESIGITAILIGALLRKAVAKDWRIKWTPLLLPLGLLFAVIMISVPTCLDLDYTFKSIRRDFLQYTLLFLVTVELFDEKIKVKNVLLIFVVANMLALLLFAIEFYLNHFNISHFVKSLANQKYFNKGLTHGSSYFLFSTTFIYLTFYYTREIKFLLPLTLLFFSNFLMLVSLNQRAALVGFLCVIAVHFLVFRHHRRKSSIVLMMVLLALGIFIYFTPMKNILIHENWSRIANFNFSPEKGIEKDSVQVRLHAQKYFLQYVVNHPLKGVGYGRKNLKEIEKRMAKPKPFPILHSHNVFLNTAIQLGLQGAAVLLFLIYVQFNMSWKGVKSATSRLDGFLFSATFLYMIGFWVRMQFDDVFRHGTAFTYWIVMGMMTSRWLTVTRQDA